MSMIVLKLSRRASDKLMNDCMSTAMPVKNSPKPLTAPMSLSKYNKSQTEIHIDRLLLVRLLLAQGRL